MFIFFKADNKSIDFIHEKALKISSSFLAWSKMIIAVSEMQAIVKLNQLYVVSPVIYNLYHLRFTQSSWVNLLILNIHKQLLRLRSETKNNHPSRSCLFSFVALIFPLKDRQVSWSFSSFLRPWRQLVIARCSFFYLCWPLEIMWKRDFLLWVGEYIYHGLKQNVVW